MLFIYSAFLLCSLHSHIFNKTVLFPCHPVVIMFYLHFPPAYRYIFHCRFGMSCFCMYCFILSRYLFRILSFASNFSLISSSCFLCFTCLFVFFGWGCGPSYLICVLSHLSHLGFEFLLVFFRRTPVLSQTNALPAQISLFNSVMLFVKICCNILFIFFRFLPWHFSTPDFLALVMKYSCQTYFSSYSLYSFFPEFVFFSVLLEVCIFSIVPILCFFSIRMFMFFSIWYVSYYIWVLLT